MGRVHTNAYLRQRHHFPEAPPIRLGAVADEVPGRAEEAAAQFGFGVALTDWRDIASDQNIDAVSITAPNFLHREIGVAMAKAGKHIWIEKPVGLSSEDAKAVAAAVEKAGVQSAVGFNYRNAPAVAMAHDLIASGELGTITHSRFRFLSDYAAHPDGGAELALRERARWVGRSGRPCLARCRPGPVPARRHRRSRGRHRDLHPPARCPDGCHQRTCARDGRQIGAGGERRLRQRAGSPVVRRTGNAGRESRGRRRAEQLRVRNPRHQGCGVLGLPPDERTRNEPREQIPGPVDHHGVGGPRRRSVCPFPAGFRVLDELRRPQGHRGEQLHRLDRRRKARGATIADAVAAAETLDAITASVASRAWVDVR